MSEYKFQSTVEPKKLAELFAVAGSEWSGHLTPQEFGQIESKRLVGFILGGRAGRGFYLQSKSGEVAAIAVVTQHKALYKEAPRAAIAAIPDPFSFGVNHITGLRVSYVFTAKEHRRKGLMERLLGKVIAYTEDEIIKKELAKSSDSKDLFKLMVTTDGKVDAHLASHYLSKKYVWYLFSAIDRKYTKFGFKAYPLEGYRIPESLGESETQGLVEKLVASQKSEGGKKLRLLDRTRQMDNDLFAQILQGRELDLLTELNKTSFHSELSGGQRSSSSLTNVTSALSAAKLGSSQELLAITELLGDTTIRSEGANKSEEAGKEKSAGLRRKSSVKQFAVPKVAILPEAGPTENSPDKFANVCGAVLTNELQHKSFYVIWRDVKDKDIYIVGMGELKLDLFGAMSDPAGFTNPVGRRRGLSFTGLNDMGGLNFQDLDLLINAAVYVSKRREHMNREVYVTMNDLPATVPAPVLHDFFLNYLPRTAPVQVAGQEGAKESNAVEFVEDYSKYTTLPMMRRFGSLSAEFDLDWTGISIATWG